MMRMVTTMSRLTYDVYLAGAMHKRLGRDVLAERENAKTICKQLGLRYYDPAEDELIKPHEIIDAKPTIKRMKWYVKKDFKNIDRCRTVVVLTGDHSSSGTMWEMARMYFIHKRPIILVAPRMYDRQFVNFTTILATKICATQKQALVYLKRRLK
jgi:nucleoside 2-deoxyribosyltransferase